MVMSTYIKETAVLAKENFFFFFFKLYSLWKVKKSFCKYGLLFQTYLLKKG